MDLQTGYLEDKEHAQIFLSLLFTMKFFLWPLGIEIEGNKAVKIVEK